MIGLPAVGFYCLGVEVHTNQYMGPVPWYFYLGVLFFFIAGKKNTFKYHKKKHTPEG